MMRSQAIPWLKPPKRSENVVYQWSYLLEITTITRIQASIIRNLPKAHIP